MDNGSEFTGNVLNAWAHDRRIEHIFTDPSSPTQNGYIERFNGKRRDECLNQNWFSNLYEARVIIEQWRMEYNHLRPNSPLGNLTPAEYTAKLAGGY